jgi:integrase
MKQTEPSQSHRPKPCRRTQRKRQAVTKLVLLAMAGLPNPANDSTNLRQIMQQNNYSADTIERYTRVLDTLTKRGANLTNPTSVTETIQRQHWDNGTRQHARNAVLLFYKYAHIAETLPTYKYTSKIMFIPTENEIDQLISGCKHNLATFLQTLNETASRYGEALNLKWTDLDTEAETLSINQPEKGSNARSIHISTKLIIMLSTLPHNTNKIFPYKNRDIVRKNYQRARKRIATNLGNPRILQIPFHTLRHWRATTELHKTNNVWTVMKLLGHKSLNNTQRYIGMLPDLTDDYISAVAHTTKEIQDLVNNGYEHVVNNGEDKIFRKRK